jgi:predicted AAA+ superfamily ATPase
MAYIKRKLFDSLKEHLGAKEISLIVGPRQAGKTTLMKFLIDFLNKQGKKSLFLNLDYEGDRIFFDSQDKLIEKIKLEFGDEKGYVFIDEMQRKENAGLFLKGIYDLDLPHKFIVSGSGSLELKEKIHESLAGRKRLFELYPIGFDEFVNFKTDYAYEKKLPDFFAAESRKTEKFLEEYLNFGGYPRVVLEKTLIEKAKIINEIFKSYLEKDASYLLNIEKTEAFSKMIKLTASQAGKLINYSSFAANLGISAATLKKYIWYAEKTFVVMAVTPFFRNRKKEITKSPIFYFYDLGLRNYSLNIFGNLYAGGQAPFAFQNLVANILSGNILSGNESLHFWRSKDRAEVDFVLESGSEIFPIEVKYSHLKKIEIGKSLRSFIDKYKPKKMFVVNLSFRGESLVGDTHVYFLPFYDLFFKPLIK